MLQLRKELGSDFADVVFQRHDGVASEFGQPGCCACQYVVGRTITTHALNTIGELYAIEKTIRGKLPAERLKVRQEQSAPIVNDLHAWLIAQLATVSKKSITATAIGYALNQWHALTLFLTDGQVEIDNSAAESPLCHTSCPLV